MKIALPLATLLATITALTAALPTSTDGKIRYDDFKVFRVELEGARQHDLLELIDRNPGRFDLWHRDDKELHVMVNPRELRHFQNFTRSRNMRPAVMISDVQALIDDEEANNPTADAVAFGWSRYHSLADIEAFLDSILAAYPNVATGFTIGQSYEGRAIRGIKISYKPDNPGIFIESNIHAREWITSATATRFINELLTSTATAVRQLAENHDWYIVPVLNVDGFVYSHETDRLWRKTRQPAASSPCIGADPNRNYDSHWMENNGASANPCSENYAGPHAFSEPEVKALANYVASIRDRLNIMLAFHSYSQVLLSPYGHTAEEVPDNFDDLMAVAKAYADAVEALPYGTEYEYGSVAGAMYVASGATNDWAYNEQGIRLSYTIELRDKGRFGQVLPPLQIIPNSEEVMAGILALVKSAGELGYLALKYS